MFRKKLKNGHSTDQEKRTDLYCKMYPWLLFLFSWLVPIIVFFSLFVINGVAAASAFVMAGGLGVLMGVFIMLALIILFSSDKWTEQAYGGSLW